MEEAPNFLRYHSLRTDFREIRLLRIYKTYNSSLVRTSLEHHDLDHAPFFYALSYTWGAAGDIFPITIGGVIIKVRVNAGSFLEKVGRLFGEVCVWMDSICINQRDDKEKSSQVQMMGTIYQHAATVLAWLGPSDADSGFAFTAGLGIRSVREVLLPELRADDPNAEESVSCVPNPWMSPKWRKHLYRSDIRRAIATLFMRPYWTRVWILQELILAQDIFFICGARTMSIEDLQILAKAYDLANYDMEDKTTFSRGWLSFHKVSSFRSHDPDKRPGWESLFLFFASHECTDPRDRVYGFRQLLPNPAALTVDYSKAPNDVLVDLLQIGLLCRGNEGIRAARWLLDAMGIWNSNPFSGRSISYDIPIVVIEAYRVVHPALIAMDDGCTSFHLVDILLRSPIAYLELQHPVLAAEINTNDIICTFTGDNHQTRRTYVLLQGSFTSSYRIATYFTRYADRSSPAKVAKKGAFMANESCVVSPYRMAHNQLMLTAYSVGGLLQRREFDPPSRKTVQNSLLQGDEVESSARKEEVR